MPANIERRYSAYTTDQLFDLVADIEKYPQFLPWIISSRIQRRAPRIVWTNMVVGIGPVRQRFTTRAVFDRPRSIEIESSDGPFKRFYQHWQFTCDAEGRVVVTYSYEFSLRSLLLDWISRTVFARQVRAVIDAFEHRARQLYGSGATPGAIQRTGAAAGGR